jgi:hypothetical protein
MERDHWWGYGYVSPDIAHSNIYYLAYKYID